MTRMAPALLAVFLFCGCSHDPEPPTTQELAQQVTELRTELANLKAAVANGALGEGSARQDGDAATLAKATQAAQAGDATLKRAIDAEVQRAMLTEADLGKRLNTVMEPRMIGPGGEDLGRWLGPTLVYLEKAGGVLDLAQQPISGVANSSPNCQGNFYTGGNPMPSGTLLPSAMGTMWRTTGSTSAYTIYSALDEKGCREVQNGGPSTGVQVVDTNIANLNLSIRDVRMELRPAWH